ncbi:MAG: prepilin peptidase [Candidatus Magasanikbacteria bacterium]|nr:prepilin peptidase [Candidatus Magasanikbacteria bacterium]
MNELIFVWAIIVAGAGVFYDIKYRIIPNWLALGGLIGALILAFFAGGWLELASHAAGLALAGGAWLVLWRAKIMGGGDQKLMSALGACFSWPTVQYFILFVALWGGAQGGLAILRNRWAKRKSEGVRPAPKIFIPYSVAIFLGLITNIVLIF